MSSNAFTFIIFQNHSMWYPLVLISWKILFVFFWTIQHYILEQCEFFHLYILVRSVRKETSNSLIVDDLNHIQYTSLTGILVVPVNEISYFHFICRRLHNQWYSRMPFVNKISTCLPLHVSIIPGVVVSIKLDQCFLSNFTSIPLFRSFFLIFNLEPARQVTCNLMAGL